MGDFAAMLDELTRAERFYDGPIPKYARRAALRGVPVTPRDAMRRRLRVCSWQIRKALRELRRPFDDAQQARALATFTAARDKAVAEVAAWRAARHPHQRAAE